MNCRKGVTLLETVFIILFIFIALLIIMPALNPPTGIHGKCSVCLSRLKQLSLGWMMYANDYDQVIFATTIGSENNVAPSWSGDVNSDMTAEEQTEAIKKGALWPYVMNTDTYKCPTGIKGNMVTYAGMCSMNGSTEGLGSGKDEEGIYITNRDNIKNPAERIDFLDIGRIPLTSYRVHYDKEQWFDMPSVRHGNGSTYSFADYHAEYYQWKGRKVIELDAENNDTVITGFRETINPAPETKKDASDLQWIQKGCWGKLGYEPSF